MKLKTKYLGLTLSSPLVVSASPLSEKLDNIRQMEDAGAGAVVMFSLFEEQIKHEEEVFDFMLESHTHSFPEAMDYFPATQDYRLAVDKYLETMSRAAEVVDMPLIGSLNGITPEGWVSYAAQMEEAGASALELNIFFLPTDLSLDGRSVEQRYLSILNKVKNQVSIPISIKLNPYFSGFAHFAKQLDDAGADGLALFNRFYQPDINIVKLELEKSLELSSPGEIRLPLLWLGALYGKLNASLAATTGVNSGTEVIKYLLAGADVVMTASALLRNGISYLEVMQTELKEWMRNRKLDSVDQVRGLLSRDKTHDTTAYDRANYIKILGSY
jgi:dihydroorotate dehydrogenase (fumarate)